MLRLKIILLIVAVTQFGFFSVDRGLDRKLNGSDEVELTSSITLIEEEIQDADRMTILLNDLNFCLWYEGYKLRGSSIDKEDVIYKNFLKFVNDKTPNEIREYVYGVQTRRDWLMANYTRETQVR